MTAGVVIRLDPWEPEYEASVQVRWDEDTPADVDTSVESDAWSALQPAAAPAPRLLFVDGVRRIEHRILVESGERTLFGLLGSFAAGATRVDPGGGAAVVEEAVERVSIAGGGQALEAMEFPLASGGAGLRFEAQAIAENTPEAPLQGLQNIMREREAALAVALGAAEGVVFVDGPLSFFASSAAPIVGVVKRLVRSYLPAEKASLLPKLDVGQRTPLFLIRDVRQRRYSWYQRIARGRRIDTALTGVVRLEASSSLELRTARRLADLGAALLPRFASAHGHDPRAPQNLYPIAGLEQALRHRLGDTHLIRRAIEAHLHWREAAA
jgi:hypothetical protein